MICNLLIHLINGKRTTYGELLVSELSLINWLDNRTVDSPTPLLLKGLLRFSRWNKREPGKDLRGENWVIECYQDNAAVCFQLLFA